MTQKKYAINLISHLIENLNAQSKTAIKVNKLLNKDWDHLGINKEEKKTLYKRLTLYIKAEKATSKRHTSCFNQIQ